MTDQQSTRPENPVPIDCGISTARLVAIGLPACLVFGLLAAWASVTIGRYRAPLLLFPLATGAVVGGGWGQVISEGSSFGLGTWLLKYSREYEREADLLGVQIMSAAGYDPRHMANLFRTIERRGGNGGPEWLSDHPSPANRYAAINREAALLRGRGTSTRSDR